MKQHASKLFVTGCIIAFIVLPVVVFGQDLGGDIVRNTAGEAGFADATETTFASTIGTGVRVILSLVGIIFTVLTVYAGMMWMTARGNESQVDTAKKTLQNSLIGLLIAIGAYAISGFVIQAFESGTSTGAGGGSAGECCIVCQGNGVSCGFEAVQEHDEAVGGCTPDDEGSFACVQPIPSSGRCRTYEDDLCVGTGRCVNRKRTDDRCAEFL